MKDHRIEDMLSVLERALGRASFDVVDHWASDLTAIGIADPRRHSRLVYIAAVDDVFDAVLEDAAESGSEVTYVEAGRYRNLNLSALIETVRLHLT